jgi:hypothetical protein
VPPGAPPLRAGSPRTNRSKIRGSSAASIGSPGFATTTCTASAVSSTASVITPPAGV